ncbi:hypothetical protein CAF53_25490 (plasmid) [Sphingobium sp. LB126]|uniref:HAD family hydrolase n=1 Tax=Sphingobium sp. LB126 TaxID=1983755 RepID=UPI000C20B152|nr:HAD hydrolase-like protein [Sphingobium sp. LB126]PJG45159.1 hypothetical protein CAF53_25490 [Sphingobium sp. LB126]
MIVGIDFDGTIVSCRDKQIACLRDGVGALRSNINWSAVWRRKRNGLNNPSALSTYKFNESEISQINDYWRRNIESRAYARYDKLLPNVRSVLESIRINNKIFLISARKNSHILHWQLKELSLLQHFSDVVVVEPARASEAKAQAFVRLGLDCYVGDTETDFAASLAAGIPGYIVSTGQRSEGFLKRSGVRNIFGGISAIQKVLNA